MEPPIPLKGIARSFWDRHAKRLTAEKILTDRSVDSFVLLCQTWAKVQILAEVETGADNYREMVQFNQMQKNYQALARQFGLLPASAKKDKLDSGPAETPDEFGL